MWCGVCMYVMYACMYVCMQCMRVIMYACMHVLSVIHACIINIRNALHYKHQIHYINACTYGGFVHAYITCMNTSHTYMHTYINRIHAYIESRYNTSRHATMHYTRACMHTCIYALQTLHTSHAYTQTYITHIHTYMHALHT